MIAAAHAMGLDSYRFLDFAACNPWPYFIPMTRRIMPSLLVMT